MLWPSAITFLECSPRVATSDTVISCKHVSRVSYDCIMEGSGRSKQQDTPHKCDSRLDKSSSPASYLTSARVEESIEPMRLLLTTVIPAQPLRVVCPQVSGIH